MGRILGKTGKICKKSASLTTTQAILIESPAVAALVGVLWLPNASIRYCVSFQLVLYR